MDFALSPLAEEIRAAARELCAHFPDTYWEEKDRLQEFPWEFYNAITSGGWMGVTVPEEYGGHGLGLIEACVARAGDRRLGRWDERLQRGAHRALRLRPHPQVSAARS